MSKVLPAALIVLLLAAGAWWLVKSGPTDNALTGTEDTAAGAVVVADGTYEVVATESRVMWAGQKPLIEGYINTGSIAVSEGTIVRAGEEVSGTFTMDMATLSVSATPVKPGKESALESHLKGERWFDVAGYPTATFVITNVAPRADSDTTFTYDITGDLTMKGKTHAVSFPAKIYEDAEGSIHASAAFEIDRTLWGITAGSASFADDLADNAVSDQVALSFALVARKTAE